MIQEIYQRGPIVCSIAVPDDLFHNYTGGIYEDKSGDLEVVHEVSVVGYGVEEGVKYWHVRNSWGTFWGEDGFFRLIRGKNNLNIEQSCAFAVPKDTWTKDVLHKTSESEKKDPNNETKNSKGGSTPELLTLIDEAPSNQYFLNRNTLRPLYSQGCRITKPSLSKGDRVSTPLPWESYAYDSLPNTWDWRDVNGTNYVSISKNQHIPIYCGSCWAHGSISALNDRFHIMFPKATPISLSMQVIVNCQPGGSSCNGGNSADVYEFVYKHGVPDDTCQQYMAVDADAPLCSAKQVCEDCTSPIPKVGEDGRVRCHAVTKYKNYYIKEYGKVSGAQKMKAEIFARGPIDCGIEVTTQFHDYKGGIYEEYKPKWDINHIISVVGWGKEGDQEFWIGRNSWGTYWGESGYFRIKMHENNNAIEEECGWAVPSLEKAISENN
jgi:cathepsin X